MIALTILMALPSNYRMAGGMVHWTNEGVDISPGGIMRYIAGDSEAGTADILEKEKAYYAACIDKTASRLELARSRIEAAALPPAERSMLHRRLDAGRQWLEKNKTAFLSAEDRADFEERIDLKMWHAVKILPTAAEGYAIACGIEQRLERIGDHRGKGEAEGLDRRAKAAFLRLLYLDGRDDFEIAEKARVEAFRLLSRADARLKRNAAQGAVE